jgi:hypothetical protein
MRAIARNILAVVAGFLIGGLVNMALIKIGPAVFPPPAGTDMTTPEGLRAAMPLLEPKHFVFPFLAHALNAFVGALVAHLLAVSRRDLLAWTLGALTLLGGIAASVMIPAPLWFKALDLVVAYLPMAGLAIRVGYRLKPAAPVSA